MVAHGRMPVLDDHARGRSAGALEIRSLVPADPFAGLIPRFEDETRVLFVLEGPTNLGRLSAGAKAALELD